MPQPPERLINARGWRFLAAALMVALTVPRLWQPGMFIDGITYAVVARNLSQGIGSLWSPSFSATTYDAFDEQLPLGMAIQSVAFWIFGDHFAVERGYSLAVFALNGLLLAAIWRRLLPPAYDWLPILVWMVPSVVTWAVVNNMLENTQALFTGLACYALLSTATTSTAGSLVLAAVAAASVVAAVLVKGPVGFFPLAMPILVALLPPEQRPRRQMVVWPAFVSVLAIISVWVLVSDGPRHAIDAFMGAHLTPALTGDRGIGPRGWDFSRHLAMGIWLRMAVVAGLAWLVFRLRRRVATQQLPVRQAAFFFAVACAASMPILVSPVLAGHYFVPSMPWFALAFAAVTLPAISAYRSRPSSLSWRLPVLIATLLLVSVVAVVATHGSLEVRSRELVRDLSVIRDVAPRGETIGACPSSQFDWELLNYFQRFYLISLQPDGEPHAGWFLLATDGCATPASCQPVEGTTKFTLLRCRAR